MICIIHARMCILSGTIKSDSENAPPGKGWRRTLGPPGRNGWPSVKPASWTTEWYRVGTQALLRRVVGSRMVLGFKAQ